MGSCNWNPSYIECRSTDALDQMQPEQRETVEQMASDLLWNWTGRLFGECPVEYRPCRQNCGKEGFSSGAWAVALNGDNSPWAPALTGGQWRNVTCGNCGDSCGCSSTQALRLPWPVSSIEEIVIDGAVLYPTEYRLDSHSLLQRLDGQGWPACQDLDLPSTEPGTWRINYLWGMPVPAGGQIAAGLLASEMAMALCNDAACKLPQRIQSVTRQGITVTMLDPFEDVNDGRTGIWLVDAWVASVTRPKRGARVFSVDIPSKRYQSGRT